MPKNLISGLYSFRNRHIIGKYYRFVSATSFWETIKGADDFDKAGSLCHGWSAIPLYFFYAYLLGVKPLEPGFTQYSNEAVRTVVENVSGRIPTPYGELKVERIQGAMDG
jgi:alpha-L-rhamnosidase